MPRSLKKRKKRLRKYVAGFGAAMSTLAMTPHADGTVVSLTADPGAVSYSAARTSPIGVNVIAEKPNFDFIQFNDSRGKSFLAAGTVISGFRQVAFSSAITTGQTFTGGFSLSPSASGTATYGFRTTANQVGWIRMDLGGPGGPISYLAAAFNDTPGGSIGAGHVVAAPIPEVSTGTFFLAGLGTLALGAVGVRRLRKRRSETSEAEES